MTAPRSAVVVLAGGSGSRMRPGADAHADAAGNKVYLSLGGKEILAHSLETIDASDVVDLVVVVVREEDRARATELVEACVRRHRYRITAGGASRHGSERAGVEAVAGEILGREIDVVAVHDAARPFMSGPLLAAVLAEAGATGGAIAGAPVEDALYRVDDGEFVDSAAFVWCQTPQAFDAATLLDVHRRAEREGFEGVDTAEVVERFSGQRIGVAGGESSNIKVTFDHDLSTAEVLAARSTGSPGAADGGQASEPDRPGRGSGGDRFVAVGIDELGLDSARASTVAGFSVERAGGRSTLRLKADDLAQAVNELPPEVLTLVFVDAVPPRDISTGEIVAMIDRFHRVGVDALVGCQAPRDAMKRTEAGVIEESIDRTKLRAVSAPEVVGRQALEAALRRVADDVSIDPSELVAAAGGRVVVVETK